MLLAIGALTGGGLAGAGLIAGVDGLGCGLGTPPVGGSVTALACEVRWALARGDEALELQEREIAGPAVKPTMAPATAPTGPSTTAPDTAPIAASAARSCALASNEMSKPATSSATTAIRMGSSLPSQPRQGDRENAAAKRCFECSFALMNRIRRRGSANFEQLFDTVSLTAICPARRLRCADQPTVPLHEAEIRREPQLVGHSPI